MITQAANSAGWRSSGDSGLDLNYDMSSDAVSDAVTEHNLKLKQVYSRPDDYLSSDSESDELDENDETSTSASVDSFYDDLHRSNNIYHDMAEYQFQTSGQEECSEGMVVVSNDLSNESLHVDSSSSAIGSLESIQVIGSNPTAL